MTVKPFTPDEALENKKAYGIPKEVIEAVNELLTENYSSGSITLGQNTVMERVLSKMPGATRSLVFARKWLDFEPIFEDFGWDVDYDKPGYCETYEATFTFTPKKGGRRA